MRNRWGGIPAKEGCGGIGNRQRKRGGAEGEESWTRNPGLIVPIIHPSLPLWGQGETGFRRASSLENVGKENRGLPSWIVRGGGGETALGNSGIHTLNPWGKAISGQQRNEFVIVPNLLPRCFRALNFSLCAYSYFRSSYVIHSCTLLKQVMYVQYAFAIFQSSGFKKPTQ